MDVHPALQHVIQSLQLIMTWIVVFTIGLQIFGIISMLRFYLFSNPKALQTEAGKYPGVSIIRPCFRASDNEAVNFDTFFKIDYPGPWEMLYVVSNESDPIVPLVKEYIARYPNVDARLVISDSRIAFWQKIDALHDGHRAAKYEIFVWSDSDVIVKPDYLNGMVASLQEPGVSIVTTPQYDVRVNNFPTALKVLGNNCDVATFAFGVDTLIPRKKKLAWGHSLGFRRKDFEEFGDYAWEWMIKFLADDLALPHLFAQKNKWGVFRNIYCPVEYSNKTLAQVIDQKRRWCICQKTFIGYPLIYILGVVVYPQVSTSLLMLFTGFSPLSIQLFGFAMLVRIVLSFGFEALFLGSIRMSLKYFWTIMIWDWMQVYFVLDAFWRDTIDLNGRRFKIEEGYFIRDIGGATVVKPAAKPTADANGKSSS